MGKWTLYTHTWTLYTALSILNFRASTMKSISIQDEMALDNMDFLILCGVLYVSIFVSCQLFFNVDRLVHKWAPYVIPGAVLLYRFQLNPIQRTSLLLHLLNGICPPHVSYCIQDLLALYALIQLYLHLRWTWHFLQFLTLKKLVNILGGSAAAVMSHVPILSGILKTEISKIEDSIGKLFHDIEGTRKTYVLPTAGMADKDLLRLMTKLSAQENAKWKQGYCSGAVYHGESDHLDVLNQAAALYSVSNPLHADVWPSVRKYEAEVISMTAGLVNGGHQSVCGVLASGGTESIVLAAKAHRDWFRKEKGITQPEIIAAVTAHAAIDKACDLLGIRLIKLPVDPLSFKLIPELVRQSISANTILLYASAPSFPQGIIDDISSLSQMALDYQVGLHVDCCLGGFILPFARTLGYDIPAFDFRLKGVSSMSCDTHKYGYASKGTSVVLYRDAAIRRYQYFCFPEWTGGLYVTPTIAGSRPGALSAACWAAMMRMGEAGYMFHTQAILETAAEIRLGIQNDIAELYVLGEPKVMVVCFGSKQLNIFQIGEFMTQKGWNLNSLQHPVSIHICVTVRHVGKAQTFLQDLAQATKECAELPPEHDDSQAASAIYGMAAAMPAGPVDDILRVYTDYSLTV